MIHGCGPLARLDNACIEVLLKASFRQQFHDADICPRTCDSDGAALCTYQNWFRVQPSQTVHFLQKVNFPAHISLIRAFLRFRLGSHNLPNVLGRFHRVPRQQRVCQACQVASLARPIGDEYHLVFECVALRSLRVSYGHLFFPVWSLRY